MTRSPSRPRRMRRCSLERLEDRALLCGDGNLDGALAIGPSDVVVEKLDDPQEASLFRVVLPEPGRLTIQTRPEGETDLETRTSLMDAEGRVLIQSDARSTTERDDQLVQHLLTGAYFVKVEGLSGTGDFALVTEFDPSTPPSDPLLVNFDRDYPFGLSPIYHVTGDFNLDGHLDIATPNSLTSDVSVLLGLGDGSFQAARNSAVLGIGAYDIAIGDFNGDPFPDLAATNLYSADISVLLGVGDGAFTSLPPIAVGAFPVKVITADFNHDGNADLAVANGHENDISLLLGQGDGYFASGGRFATGNFPSYLATGDFDQDGFVDLAVSNFNSNDISLLRGTASGAFAPEVRIATVSNPSQMVAGDFNRDGRLDLAGVNTGTNDFSIHFGNGDGTFFTQTQLPTGSAPIGLVAADFNGDGLADLAASNRHGRGLSVFLAREDGSFQDQVPYRVGLQPWYILAGDFNEDGRVDLATANARSHDISILLGLGDGTFQQDPTESRQEETNPQGMVARDFNGDGILDLAAVSYSGGDLFVFLGRGDGTFGQRMRFAVDSTPVELLSEDFNGDGRHDLVTINCDAGNVSVLLGRGDGTFDDKVAYGSSLSGEFGVSGDFNGDGRLDIIGSGQFATGIAFLAGRGDGSFGERSFFALDEAPADGVAGDFNHDGRLDLATTNFFGAPDYSVSIHLGRGDGTFDEPAHLAVGESPLGIVASDFSGDGHLDLVSANFRSDPPSLSLLVGRGDGTFASEVRIATGLLPDFLLARDFDGDGHLDLVVSNAGSTDVAVHFGRGDGTFADAVFYAVGDGPTPRRGLEAADFDGDGRLDLAIPQVLSNDVAILLGEDDGRFAGPLRFPVGLGPAAIAAGDYSGDGRPDVASVNPTTNELTISLGAAGATLRHPQHHAVGLAPVALAQGDFNRDGRLDVAVANQGSDDLSILLGLGTGVLRDETRVKVGDQPVAVVAGDFNGDSFVDLAVANSGSNDLSVLMGRGDGTFQRTLRLAAGELPQSLAAGDFNGDGRLDLAAANYRSQDVSVFLGRGNGTFAAPVRIALGTSPAFLLADDLDGDGRLDLATANPLSHDLSLLRGRGDGTFASAVRIAAGQGPVWAASGDFDGDGRTDLATANSLSDDVTFLLARGDGTFRAPQSQPVGDYPAALVVTDFNDDARFDLVVASHLASDLTVLQGLGEAAFAPAGTVSDPRPSTPLAADLNGDAALDVVVLDLSGQILLREARPGSPGVFESPAVVNPDPRFAVRDVAVLDLNGSMILAALDAKSPSISFYSSQEGGTFLRTAGPSVPGTLPVAIRAGDLDGDGRSDLVVAAAGSSNVLVYFQAGGGFPQDTADMTIEVGISPSAIELVDVDGDGRLDIVVTNQFSGDVSLLLADDLSCHRRFRAATGLHGLVERDGRQVVRSLAAPADVAAGHFNGDNHLDLVVANRGTNSISFLPGSGHGGLVNPDRARTYPTGLEPTVMVTGRFNDDSFVDLAVLNEGSRDLSIYLADGQGNFVEKLPSAAGPRLSAGNLPSGLAVHDVNDDGRADLLVGNEFGDLLVLLGNGDGTFQPYERVGLSVALAIADLNGDGAEDFVFSSESRDRVTVQYSQPGQSFVQGRSEGVLAPGAVRSTDLNRDGHVDLVVANSGANNVLVYLGARTGQFAPAQTFFAGTKPVGVTIDDLNRDGLDDLVVANEGSNDLSVLLGQQSSAGWTLASGPRLRAGAGPVATTVQDATDDGIPDILVSNRQAGTIALLAGVGQGFFDDRNPIIHPVSQPGQILPVDPGSLVLNSQGLTFFPDFVRSPGISISTGGGSPTAAVTGDFNFDGIGDLVVAHHDGVVSLLLGDRGGFSLRDPFTHPDVPHPVALAAVAVENAYNLYVVNEGQESAVLLTTFGIPLPRPSLPLPPLITVLLLAGPATLVSPDVLTISEPSDSVSEADDGASDGPPAPAEPAAGGKAGASAEGEPDDALDAPPGVIDLMLSAAEAIAANLRQSSSGALVEERVDRVFAAIDEQLDQWLKTACDQLAQTQVEQLWDAVLAPFQSCARELAGTLWDLLGSQHDRELPPMATDAPAGENAASSLPRDCPLSIDPWLAAVAIAGLVGCDWLAPAAGPAAAEKISSPRARSRCTSRPTS